MLVRTARGQVLPALDAECIRADVLGAGVSDHGALTGLGDDDHTQYHTDARGDARYSQLGHTHDDRYYTESEVDTALAGKSDTSHNHDHGALTGLGDDDHTQYHTDARGDARYVKLSLADAKGDIFAAAANDTVARLAVGTNGQVLMADSLQSTGLRWSKQIDTAVRSADYTVNNTTTYTTALSLSGLDTDAYYTFDACLEVLSTTSADFKVNFTGPTGAKMGWGYDLDTQSVTTLTLGGGQGFQATGANALVFLRGYIKMGSTSGAINMGFAQLTAEVSNTILREGSWLKAVLTGYTG